MKKYAVAVGLALQGFDCKVDGEFHVPDDATPEEIEGAALEFAMQSITLQFKEKGGNVAIPIEGHVNNIIVPPEDVIDFKPAYVLETAGGLRYEIHELDFLCAEPQISWEVSDYDDDELTLQEEGIHTVKMTLMHKDDDGNILTLLSETEKERASGGMFRHNEKQRFILFRYNIPDIEGEEEEEEEDEN